MIAGKTVVYTSGTFDMLHINHLRLIEYARGLGDILIVGVNTDELVASYKSLPMIPFEDRIALVRALKGPDLVIPQHSLDHADKVKKLKFDVFVVGDDWVGKYDYLEEQGVTVVYTPYGRGVSSSSLKTKIAARYAQLKRKSETLIPDDALERERGIGNGQSRRKTKKG
jgi:choline-phosphate cytidylyltransferase/glycerol-3-phosphate cytidylyltransferase